MNRGAVSVTILVVLGVVVAGASLLVRRRFPRLENVDPGPWSSTLSYVATAYGVVVGFSIIFLFGLFSDARQAVGDEATSIGTAFDQAMIFPDQAPDVQHALICYSKAVPAFDWPALRDRESAPEVDTAYADLILSLDSSEPAPDGAFRSATATNLVSQLGAISTARETRLVTAESILPGLLWVLLIGGGLFVIGLIFVVTLPAPPRTQSVLVALSAVFTTVLMLIVFALNNPFADGAGRVSPRLIEETTASMVAAAPDVADRPCDYSD